jgi:hypothetical protein
MRLTVPTPAFLDDQEIVYNCAQAGLGEIATQALRNLARRINADPQLRQVTTTAHQRVYDTNADFTDAARQADAALGAEADLLHGLFVLDSMRLVRQRHAARGVPPDISRAVPAARGCVAQRGGAAARAYRDCGLDAGLVSHGRERPSLSARPA